jgi:hypothetical protein
MRFKCWKVMKMKYSLVHSTMRVIPSSLDRRITHAGFGKTRQYSKASRRHLNEEERRSEYDDR